jgi:hypothetical protein
MGDFGYAKRGRAVNEAQAEIHAAFKEVGSRNDESDPRTKRWLEAIKAFGAARSRVYPDDLRLVEQGALPASEVDTADILDLLEADPVFYGSGYMKEELLGALKKRSLQQHEVQRLQAIILSIVRKADRREFRRYCRVATTVYDERFMEELKALEVATVPDFRRRSGWVLAALREANRRDPE